MNRPITPAEMVEGTTPMRRQFHSHDGTKLSFLHWPASRMRRGAVIMVHRGHEHGERLAHVVDEAGLHAFDVYALDMRGHGASGGPRGGGMRFDQIVRDLDCFAGHLRNRDGIALHDTAIIGQSVGAVVAAAWVHDYGPPIRAMVLAAPAFDVRLYVPFAETGIRQAVRAAPRLRIKSYVTGRMLTADRDRAASYRSDDRITRGIPARLLIDLRDTARRIVADAAMIDIPTQVLIAGDDRVVAQGPIETFCNALTSTRSERQLYPDLKHDLLGERDRAPVMADLSRFIDDAFAAPAGPVCLLDADKAGPGREEADRLASPPPSWSMAALRWRAMRAAIGVGARLSQGMAIGRDAGFDSGAALDYVYRKEAAGLGPIGRMVDRIYLEAPGWQGIRQRRRHLEDLIAVALSRLEAEGMPRHILDIAAGHGRYVLGLPPELLERVDTIHLRDYCERNVAAGRARLNEAGLGKKARFEKGDAFDGDDLAALRPRPTLAIVSGLYELYDTNGPVRSSLDGLSRAVPEGGYLLYTNQPWHPQLEFIARALTSHRGGRPWVMRRRSQAEMDQLVAAAGFEKLTQRIDRLGIFTVSLARRLG
ncbi:MAG: alpha/beta fold hydrolase [Pseudomonadota bacterium]